MSGLQEATTQHDTAGTHPRFRGSGQPRQSRPACGTFPAMLKSLPIAALVSVALASSISAQQRTSPIDWDGLTAETVGMLSGYIKVNTTNPAGRELEAARFLKRVLDKEGIENRI